MIPAKASAVFNIRFNDLHSSATLGAWLRETFDAVGGDYDLTLSCSGESFLTEPGPLSARVAEAVKTVNPLQASGKLSTLWLAFARYYEDHGDLDNARVILEKATPFMGSLANEKLAN